MRPARAESWLGEADGRLGTVLAALSEASAGVAMFWLTPRAPTTLPASDAGTDISLVARRTVWPFTW